MVFRLRWKFKEVCSDTRQRNAIAGTDELPTGVKASMQKAASFFYMLQNCRQKSKRSPFLQSLRAEPQFLFLGETQLGRV